jgi:hypothetical protein
MKLDKYTEHETELWTIYNNKSNSPHVYYKRLFSVNKIFKSENIMNDKIILPCKVNT